MKWEKMLIFFYFSSAHLWIAKFIQNFREGKINNQEPIKTEDSLSRLINSASLFLGKERTGMLYTVFLAMTEKINQKLPVVLTSLLISP